MKTKELLHSAYGFVILEFRKITAIYPHPWWWDLYFRVLRFAEMRLRMYAKFRGWFSNDWFPPRKGS